MGGMTPSCRMKPRVSRSVSYTHLDVYKRQKQVRIIPEVNFYLDTTLDDVERIEKELKGLGDNPIL